MLGSGYNVRRVGQIVWVDLTKSEEDLLENISKEGRKKLRQAESRGVEVKMLPPDGFSDFIPLYRETMEHHLANERYLYPDVFFENMMRTPEEFCFVMGAFVEEQLVSSVIVLAGGEVGYSYLSATNRDFQNYRPNNYLFWKMLRKCKQMGLKYFVLGGGAAGNDGTYKFKLNFSSLEKDFYIFDRLHDPETYKRIIEIKTEFEHTQGRLDFDPTSIGFFPIYRCNWRNE
ncbi:MAG: GNAT family N-acetyltransferase [Caldisericia bacterium]